MCSAVADAGHGGEELLEAGGIGVEGFKTWRFAGAGFVLRLAGAESLGEVAPEGIEAVVGHLEDAAHVGRLLAIEEEIGGGGVGVFAVLPLEETKGDESVEEIPGRPGVQAEAPAQGFEGLRSMGQFGEDSHLNGAEKDFRGPEAKADLENVFRCGVIAHIKTLLGQSFEIAQSAPVGTYPRR